MLEQRGREGREIGVGVGEQNLRVRRLSDLYQTALVAEGNLEGKRELSLAEIGLCQKAIGERCLAEIKERLQRRGRDLGRLLSCAGAEVAGRPTPEARA